MLTNLFYPHKKYHIARRVKIKNTDLGFMCNIAYEADLRDSIVGKRTSIGRFTTMRNCTIGSYCAVSWNVSLGAKNHHYDFASISAAIHQERFGLIPKSFKMPGETPKTTIGNDVWIGCNAVILSGVSIGDGAVIGAGAVVTKDVAPYSIVAGCPAHHIRYRFEKEIRENLMKAQWWNWDDTKMQNNIDLFHQKMNKDISLKMCAIGEESSRYTDTL